VKDRIYSELLPEARQDKTSCMSNTKWCKLFWAIENNGKCSFPAELKLLWEERTYPFSTNPGVDESREYTKDSGIQGPVAFRDIEWIYIPSIREVGRYNRDEKLKSKFVHYDLGILKELMDNLGKFEYDFDADGLKIYGFR